MTDIIETLPPVLRGLCRWVMEDLPPIEADSFRADLTDALQSSTADLERVGWRVMHKMLLRLPVQMPAIDIVIEGIGRLAQGGEWPAEDALAAKWATARVAETAANAVAEAAAEAAADAADAAWAAAEAADAAGAAWGAQYAAYAENTAGHSAGYAAYAADQEAEIRQQAADILEALRYD